MKTTLGIIFNYPAVILAVALIAAGGTPSARAAGTTTWSGAGADQNWSTAGNWTTVGGSTPPGTGDAVIFRNTGGAAAAGTVDNVVDAGFTAAIGSLLFTNETANLYHTTQIPSGNTLTISGPVTVGGTNQTATYTFTGGGTLRGGTGTSTFVIANENGGTMTVDLSTLSNFVFNAGGAGGNFNLGLDAGFNSGGVIKLAAASNNITASTLTVGQNNNGGTATMLNLGAGTNIINADTVRIAWDKINGMFQFNSATGGLRLRNAAGTGGDTFSVCDNAHSGSAGATTVGTVSLNGHYVDMMINTLTLANRHARSGGSDNAYFSFDTGIVSCTNITGSINTSGGTGPTNIISVGGGLLKVANTISLVNCAGNPGLGVLIVTNGGTVNAGSIIKTTSVGVGIVSITNATVAITSGAGGIGTAAAPIDTLNLNNATLRLNLDGNNIGTTTIVATTLNTNGANVIKIDSIVNASGTVTFPLINYLTAGNDPFASLSLVLPLGYTGNLVDDTADQMVQLTVTVPVANNLVWVGATNSVLVSNWDTNKTKDWVDQATLSIPQVYADPDNVTFDDTASTNVVTLVTTNTPAAVTVNNNSLNYTFNGVGKITGATGLTKQGGATLTLAESGGDDFTGNIALNGGTLIFDNTNSAIGGGLTIAYGTTAQIGDNDGGGNLPSGTLDDEGTLVFQRADNVTLSTSVPGGGGLTQDGNGTLTLSAANAFTGTAVASKGRLALAVGNALATSYGLLVSNATFDVSGVSGLTGLNDFSITNATITLAVPANLQAPLGVNTFEADGTPGHNNIINVTALPGIAAYPATVTLIKSTNMIMLAGGNFNFALGSLPAATPNYAGSLSESGDGTAILLTLTAGPTGARAQVTWDGTNNLSATTNWSDNLNWQLPGAPGAADNVIFGNNGSGTDPVTVNNVVDTSFNVASLTYNQNGGGVYHVTEIPAGNTLTVSGNLTVGGQSGVGVLTPTYFTGGGALLANGSAFTVNDSDTGGSSSSLATLDLSGLNYFIFNSSAGTMNVANATSGNRFGGLFVMAAGSNNVTASTINLEANNASNAGNGGSGIQFGAGTNVINVGQFNIVNNKSSGTVKFVSGAPATAGLRLRGVNGNTDDTSRANIIIASRVSTGTGTTTGALALNGNPVDIKVGTLLMGEDTQSGGNGANGTLTFDTGTVDATTITMGHAGNSAVLSAVGTLNVGSAAGSPATLIIGSGGLSMVNQASGAGAAGNLNITGGTVICANNIVKATTAGTATISLTDGTLNMVSGAIGTLATPIDTLNLSDNGTLDTKIQLNVVTGVTNICASAVNILSGVTTLNIASFAGVIGTTQIPLISYNNGVSPIAGLALGTVPAGYTVGSLIDNTANETIDVLVTPPAPTVWVGAVGSVLNSSWDTSTLNWLNGATPTTYSDVDFVQFDDSASNSVVTLATTVSPGGLDVSNNVLNYTFNGSGAISGVAGLAKQGSGTLILDNSGANNFSGGVNLVGGTLQIGNNDVNGNLPATGGIVDNASLIFNRTDSNTVANAISGTGTVTQNGAGVTKLAAVNTYSGTTLISAGMIIATNATAGNSSIGSSAGVVIITNGGTLDIENPTAQALSFTNTTDDGGKQFFIAGAGVGGNGAIVNNGTVNQQNALQSLTLTADATVGGPARWDMRVPDGHFGPVLDLRGFTLTKTGSNQMSMVNLTVTNGGNIIINSGIFSFETTSSNSATHITINAGGVMGHYRENAGYFTAPITLNGGMIRDLNGTPGSTNDSPITLTANSFLDLNVGSADLLQLNGVISESGGSFGLTKTNVGSYALSAANTYSGTTFVAQGRLILVGNGSIAQSSLINVAAGATFDASQRDDQTLSLSDSQTLSGFGTVTGIVTTASGSTIAPGLPTSIGTLTLANNVNLAGTNVMKLNRTSGATNDMLNVGGALVEGGTLNVTLLGGTPVAGDSFTLFTAAGGISGAFTVTNLPVLPGFAWVTTNLANGVLSIVASVSPNPTNISASVSGNVLTLSWPADHTGWVLQSQTNGLGAGLSAGWSDVAASGSSNTNIITIDPANPAVFYRLRRPF